MENNYFECNLLFNSKNSLSTFISHSIKILPIFESKHFEILKKATLQVTFIVDKVPLNFIASEDMYIVKNNGSVNLPCFLNGVNDRNKLMLIEMIFSNAIYYGVLHPICNDLSILSFLNSSSTENINTLNPTNINDFFPSTTELSSSLFGLDHAENERDNGSIENKCFLCTNTVATNRRDAQTQTEIFQKHNYRNHKTRSNLKHKGDPAKYKDTVGSCSDNKRDILNKREHSKESAKRRISLVDCGNSVQSKSQLILSPSRTVINARRMLTPNIPLKRMSPSLRNLLGGKILSTTTSSAALKLPMGRLQRKHSINTESMQTSNVKDVYSNRMRESILFSPVRPSRSKNTPSKFNDYLLTSPRQKMKSAISFDGCKDKKLDEVSSIWLSSGLSKNIRHRIKKPKYTPIKLKLHSKSFKITPSKSFCGNRIKKTLTHENIKSKSLLMRHASSLMSNRAEIIIQKSKEVALQRNKHEEELLNRSNNSLNNSLKRNSLTGLSEAKEDNNSAAFQEHKNKEELLSFLKKAYSKIVEGEGSPLTGSKSIISACYHHFNSQITNDAHEEVQTFIKTNFLKTNAQIREEYMDKTDSIHNDMKLREYEIQIFLEFELHLNNEINDKMEQSRIVAILRAMSFMHDTFFLNNYLNTVLFANYLPTCPNLLHAIYEDLLLPIPSELHHLSSPSSHFLSEEDPINNVILSPKTETTIETAPWEDLQSSHERHERPSQLLRNVSFSQAPRRQIELNLPHHASSKSRRSDRIASVKKNKSINLSDDNQVTEKVRRSLFDDRSMAPKSFCGQTNYITPKKSELVLKTRKVAETPTSRQGIKRSLKRQERISRKLTQDDIRAVANTPGKDLHSDFLACSQASLGETHKNLFYSTKSEACKPRSINRYQNLEDRMTNSSSAKNISVDLFNVAQMRKTTAAKLLDAKPLLVSPLVDIPVEKYDKSFMSPRRVTARVLFAPLLSPTPTKKSLFSSKTPNKDAP